MNGSNLTPQLLNCIVTHSLSEQSLKSVRENEEGVLVGVIKRCTGPLPIDPLMSYYLLNMTDGSDMVDVILYVNHVESLRNQMLADTEKIISPLNRIIIKGYFMGYYECEKYREAVFIATHFAGCNDWLEIQARDPFLHHLTVVPDTQPSQR